MSSRGDLSQENQKSVPDDNFAHMDRPTKEQEKLEDEPITKSKVIREGTAYYTRSKAVSAEGDEKKIPKVIKVNNAEIGRLTVQYVRLRESRYRFEMKRYEKNEAMHLKGSRLLNKITDLHKRRNTGKKIKIETFKALHKRGINMLVEMSSFGKWQDNVNFKTQDMFDQCHFLWCEIVNLIHETQELKDKLERINETKI